MKKLFKLIMVVLVLFQLNSGAAHAEFGDWCVMKSRADVGPDTGYAFMLIDHNYSSTAYYNVLYLSGSEGWISCPLLLESPYNRTRAFSGRVRINYEWGDFSIPNIRCYLDVLSSSGNQGRYVSASNDGWRDLNFPSITTFVNGSANYTCRSVDTDPNINWILEAFTDTFL